MTDTTPIAHILSPKHALLSDQETTDLLAHYNISKRQLPSISIKDPAIRHLTIKHGDVIKITRPSLTQGTAVFYRAVKAT